MRREMKGLRVLAAPPIVLLMLLGMAAADEPGPEPKPELKPKKLEPEPTFVPPKVLAARRIAGETQILPPDGVLQSMRVRDDCDLRAKVRLCIGNDGVPDQIAMVESTGYPAYDERLVQGMGSWRYHPYLRNGTAVPVCTQVIFLLDICDGYSAPPLRSRPLPRFRRSPRPRRQRASSGGRPRCCTPGGGRRCRAIRRRHTTAR